MGLAIGILAIVGLVLLGAAAGGVLLLLFVAVLLASALEPGIGTVRERLPLGRGSTILVVYVTFFVLVIGLAFIVVPASIRQAEDLLAALPPFFEQARAWASDLRPAALGDVGSLVEEVAAILRPPPPPDPDTVVEVGTPVAEATVAVHAADDRLLLARRARPAAAVLPGVPARRSPRGARNAWNEIETRLGLWVRGQLILMGAMGAATTVTYTLLGLPGALLLGLIAALTEAIPIVGPLLGAIRPCSWQRPCRPSWRSPSP